MSTSGRTRVLFFALVMLVSMAACGSKSPSTTATSRAMFSNIPLGSGTDPEPGTDGKPRPSPNGHYESIVVANGLTYIGSDNGTLYALGAKDGTVRWQDKVGATTYVYAVVNGVVYVSADTMVYAFNASNGTLLWRYRADKFISDVLVVNGVIYVNTSADSNSPILYALKAADGSLLWRYSYMSVSPGLLEIMDGTVYVSSELEGQGNPELAQTIYAFRASDAHMLWHTRLESTDGRVGGTTVANGVVYITTVHGAIYALRADTGSKLWHVAQPIGQDFSTVFVPPTVVDGVVCVGDMQGISAYRASDGTRLWQYKRNNFAPFIAQPVVTDGAVYFGSPSGFVAALRVTDGGVLWQHQATGVFRPLIAANGLVINVTGPVYALRASDGAELWQRDVEGTGESSPGGQPEVVGEGVVYIGSQDGSVQAIQASDGKLLWQYMIQEQVVTTPPVYAAYVTFAAPTSYQQALLIVTDLGLKTFADCHFSWTQEDEKDQYPSSHALVVAAMVNSAPLWLDRLKVTPGVKDVQAWGPHSCPLQRENEGIRRLSSGQVGTFVRVTFAGTTQYDMALDAVNALGFRLADPCYEQARAQGTKPSWHSMGQADAFGKTHMFLLATTFYNAIGWMSQLRAVPGVVKIEAAFKMDC